MTEAADHELGLAFLQLLKEYAGSHRAAPGSRHDFHEGIRIDIEITYLDHLHRQLLEEGLPARQFLLAVIEAGEIKHVQGNVDPMGQRVADGFLDRLELIAAAIIGGIALRQRTDDAHAHRIEPRIDNLPDALRIARIRIDIDLALVRSLPDELNAACNVVRGQRRLALAALSKADDALGRTLQVVDADLGNLLRCRPEFDAALR